jgi:hypothetical protein
MTKTATFVMLAFCLIAWIILAANSSYRMVFDDGGMVMFKIGDKVRVVAYDECDVNYGVVINKTGIVKEVGTFISVALETLPAKLRNNWLFDEHELELIEND